MNSSLFVCILKLYFASTSQKTIERVDLNGGSRDVLVSDGLDSPEGLAIDWIHRRMYWTDTRHVVLIVHEWLFHEVLDALTVLCFRAQSTDPVFDNMHVTIKP